MPGQDQQPEEAASRGPAAAASFAGSLAQTKVYGRGLQQRADAKKGANKEHEAQQPAEDGQAPAAQQPAEETRTLDAQAPDTPPVELGDRLPEEPTDEYFEQTRGLVRHIEELDAEYAASQQVSPDGIAGKADAATADIGAELTERAVGGVARSLDEIDAQQQAEDGAALACQAEDSAAAQARLVRGQLELPVAGAGVPAPAPAVLPPVVPGL